MEARERILNAAARLLSRNDGEPVSTRAICAEAGVGPPSLYHHFGDKAGLFDAVVTHGFESYLDTRRHTPTSGDPQLDLRNHWDAHVEFGVANPNFYAIMYGSARPGGTPSAAHEAHARLTGILERLAHAGLLHTDVELAAQMLEASLVGTTLHLINDPDNSSGTRTSARLRDTVLDSLTSQQECPSANTEPAGAAAQLLSLVTSAPPGFSDAETALLRQWLAALAATGR